MLGCAWNSAAAGRGKKDEPSAYSVPSRPAAAKTPYPLQVLTERIHLYGRNRAPLKATAGSRATPLRLSPSTAFPRATPKKVFGKPENLHPGTLRFTREASVAVIAVIQQKGGVGKSTITANVAGELVRKGRTVKVLDLDPQQSLVIWAQLGSGVLRNIVEPVSIEDPKEFKATLDRVKKEADRIFLDCPPGLTGYWPGCRSRLGRSPLARHAVAPGRDCQQKGPRPFERSPGPAPGQEARHRFCYVSGYPYYRVGQRPRCIAQTARGGDSPRHQPAHRHRGGRAPGADVTGIRAK